MTTNELIKYYETEVEKLKDGIKYMSESYHNLQAYNFAAAGQKLELFEGFLRELNSLEPDIKEVDLVNGTERVIEFSEQCDSCKGTGLYVGTAERDGAAVVCFVCKGTGEYLYRHTYTEFTGRKTRDDVRRVYKTNPGIIIGDGPSCSLLSFGGMTYQEWLSGKDFPEGSEMRKYTCPKWWCQSAGIKCEYKWCTAPVYGSFSDCNKFAHKDECWKKYDKELIK